MKKKMLVMMALLFVAAVATSAFAFGGGRGPGYGPCGQGDARGLAALNLTAEQTAQIKAMREAHWKDMKPLRDKMFAKRDELRKLWLEPNPDEGKILAAQKEMRSLREQMEDKMTAYRLEAVKVLTPEQKEKMGSFAGRGPGHRRGFGPMHGFGPAGPDEGGCFGAPLGGPAK
jgi:Spy/CpxP family protein refolding chaperone